MKMAPKELKSPNSLHYLSHSFTTYIILATVHVVTVNSLNKHGVAPSANPLCTSAGLCPSAPSSLRAIALCFSPCGVQP